MPDKSRFEQLLDRFNELDRAIEDYQSVMERALQKQQALDSVQTAAELGRLDVVTIILAVLSVVLAVGALIGFIEVRTKALQVARDSAREEAARIMDGYLNEEAPGLIRSHMDLIGPTYGGWQGDAVAKNYGDGQSENENTTDNRDR